MKIDMKIDMKFDMIIDKIIDMKINMKSLVYQARYLSTLRSLLNEQATLSEQGGIFLKNS